MIILQKNIYTQLTPEQYYSVISCNKNVPGENCDMRGFGMREKGRDMKEDCGRFKGKGMGQKDIGTTNTMKDFVIKMLKDKSTK